MSHAGDGEQREALTTGNFVALFLFFMLEVESLATESEGWGCERAKSALPAGRERDRYGDVSSSSQTASAVEEAHGFHKAILCGMK